MKDEIYYKNNLNYTIIIYKLNQYFIRVIKIFRLKYIKKL